MRYRHGDSNPVVSPAVAAATEIKIGDMVTGTPAAAASVAWSTNLTGTQEAFHDEFLGVAAQASRVGDVSPIRVNTSAVHEFDCDSATFTQGQLVGPAKQTGNALENQKVVAVATENLAIGRVYKPYATATTKVMVEITSTKMRGGPQAMA